MANQPKAPRRLSQHYCQRMADELQVLAENKKLPANQRALIEELAETWARLARTLAKAKPTKH